jgi:hypothetical protein
VDDVLAISASPDGIMKSIQGKFKLKGDKYTPSTDYLGAQLSRMTNANGTQCWTQSSDKCVEESVKTVEEFLRSKGKILPRTPMRSDYKPELDTSPELAAEGHSNYQELIGILRWAAELGRLDILLEVKLMSIYLATPREQVFHIFGDLKKVPKCRIASDGNMKSPDGNMKTVWEKVMLNGNHHGPPMLYLGVQLSQIRGKIGDFAVCNRPTSMLRNHSRLLKNLEIEEDCCNERMHRVDQEFEV